MSSKGVDQNLDLLMIDLTVLERNLKGLDVVDPSKVVNDQSKVQAKVVDPKKVEAKNNIYREILKTEVDFFNNIDLACQALEPDAKGKRYEKIMKACGGNKKARKYYQDMIEKLKVLRDAQRGLSKFLLSSTSIDENIWKEQSEAVLRAYADYVSFFGTAPLDAKLTEKLCKAELKIKNVAGQELDINAIIIQPIQRIPRYPLLGQEMQKAFQTSEKGHQFGAHLVKFGENLAKAINDRKRESLKETSQAELPLAIVKYNKFRTDNNFDRMLDIIGKGDLQGDELMDMIDKADFRFTKSEIRKMEDKLGKSTIKDAKVALETVRNHFYLMPAIKRYNKTKSFNDFNKLLKLIKDGNSMPEAQLTFMLGKADFKKVEWKEWTALKEALESGGFNQSNVGLKAFNRYLRQVKGLPPEEKKSPVVATVQTPSVAAKVPAPAAKVPPQAKPRTPEVPLQTPEKLIETLKTVLNNPLAQKPSSMGKKEPLPPIKLREMDPKTGFFENPLAKAPPRKLPPTPAEKLKTVDRAPPSMEKFKLQQQAQRAEQQKKMTAPAPSKIEPHRIGPPLRPSVTTGHDLHAKIPKGPVPPTPAPRTPKPRGGGKGTKEQ